YSVLEVVRAFEKAAGRKIPYRIAARRPGDIAASYADPSLAHRLLNWRTTRDLEAMCADAWRFIDISLLGST
ncbi:MAG: UDP-glucose 4-epimerase, partial [Pseudomonadota bacterium]